MSEIYMPSSEIADKLNKICKNFKKKTKRIMGITTTQIRYTFKLKVVKVSHNFCIICYVLQLCA